MKIIHLTMLVVTLGLFVNPDQLMAQSKMKKLRQKASDAILNGVESVVGDDKVERISSEDEVKILRRVTSLSERMAKNEDKLEHLLENWEDLDTADPGHILECKDCNNLFTGLTRGTSLARYIPRFRRRPRPLPVVSGYLSGFQLNPCNCSGFIRLGTIQVNSQCRSGFMVAVGCPGFCSPNTVQWAWVCQ